MSPQMDDTKEEYIGIYVVSYQQVLETQTLHWGVFLGKSMRDYGELHNFVCPMTGKYHYVVENDHIPIGGPSTLRYVAAHRVGEMPADSIPYFKLLVTTMSLPPGADCQVWSHSAMDTLERSLLGWVDTKKRLILDENLPSRKDPNGVYLSTRRNMCDLDLLDSEDYVHSTKPVTKTAETGSSEVKQPDELERADKLHQRIEKLVL